MPASLAENGEPSIAGRLKKAKKKYVAPAQPPAA